MQLHYRDGLARLLWLIRGRESVTIAAGEWSALLDVARRERLVGLAWHRAGERIRRLAPATVAANWRAEVLRDIDRGEAQRLALGELLGRIAELGVEAVVLKGAPLSQRLYGDADVRPSQDIDIFVGAEQRPIVSAQLEALGWRAVGGGAPWEESFHLPGSTHQLLLEVHSWMLDDPVLVHLGLPAPDSAPMRVGALECRAHDGELLPGFLATHLAKHDNAPLLWLHDLSVLWGALDAAQRDAAWAAARRYRLHRYLRWAVRRVDLLEAAASGDAAALGRLGYHADGRRESHGLVRLARLASGPRDAAAVIAGRLWPPHLRDDGRGFVRQAADRLGGRMGGRGRSSGGEAVSARDASAVEDPAGTRGLDVEREEFAGLLQDLMSAGVGTWIRARGESMEPTIPTGSLVHVVAPAARLLSAGEVVLARMPNGSFALHRVLWERDGMVAMQGDNVPRRDPEIRRASILGLADLVEVNGRVRPIPAAPTPLQRSLSKFGRRVRRRFPWLARHGALGFRTGRAGQG